MEQLGCCEIRQMLLACADRIIRNEPYLTRVDSAIGDGDHGIGMKNGMQAARRYLETAENEQNVYALYANMASAMQAAMGGASGMIFSTLFAGKAAEHAPASAITPKAVSYTHLDVYKRQGLHSAARMQQRHATSRTCLSWRSNRIILWHAAGREKSEHISAGG